MARIKLKIIKEMNSTDLVGKLRELRTDLSKLKSESAKGTLKKESGDIRWVRRDIARIMTILNERNVSNT